MTFIAQAVDTACFIVKLWECFCVYAGCYVPQAQWALSDPEAPQISLKHFRPQCHFCLASRLSTGLDQPHWRRCRDRKAGQSVVCRRRQILRKLRSNIVLKADCESLTPS